MKLIVGLGNPGQEYEKNRHNVGFIVVSAFVGNNKWQQKGNYLETTVTYENEKIILIKPLTYMNLSGEAVLKAKKFYKIDNQDILVIHDDLDLPSMSYRFKYASSSGGHNGIKSIINLLHTEEFARLKVGIGASKGNTASYVLGNLSNAEIDFLKSNIFKEMIEYYIKNGIEKTMNKFNKNGAK